jgi:hypothetical protein
VAPQQTRSPTLSVRDWSPVIYASLRRPEKFNPLHLVVAGKTLVAIVPFYGEVSQLSRGDFTTISQVAIEANASADL